MADDMPIFQEMIIGYKRDKINHSKHIKHTLYHSKIEQ